MKAVDEKVGRFIGNSDTVFIIPPFQRNYSWDEEQCCESGPYGVDAVRCVGYGFKRGIEMCAY